MPQQLTFELAPPAPPLFENFLPGDNQELLDALMRAARGELTATGLVLWGPPGAGKSHLLGATVAAAQARGHAALLMDADALAGALGDEPVPADALVAVDDVDRAPPHAQGHLFTLYNRLAAGGGSLVVGASVPPARLALRPDLRTRLGQGLVYEVVTLHDGAKPAALRRYAQARGLPLPEDVIDYLLAHYERDMPSLLRTVAALDRHSLAMHRPLTVPFVREALASLRS